MFVDACVIVSIFMKEGTKPAYEAALQTADHPFTSPLAAWEAIIILSHPDRLDLSYSAAHADVTEWLGVMKVDLRDAGEPHEVLRHAVAIAERHGVSRRGLSNFDCFHYAQAKAAGVPLLTLDRLLRETDVETLPTGS